MTSLTLLERLRDPADSDAWLRFHEFYSPIIRVWLVRRGLQEQDANDVQQEVLRVAVVDLPKFGHNGHTGALRCWLRTAVSNQLRTFWRRKKRAADAVGGSEHQRIAEQLEDPNSAMSQAWDHEYRRAVCVRLLENVAHEFEGKTMEAFRKVALEGQSAKEVASGLGMTANAVRIAQSRVLQRMRQIAQGMLD